jgi:hypothetical protein
MAPIPERRRQRSARLKNSWWYTHRVFNSKARLVYANAAELPDAIGTFDIALAAEPSQVGKIGHLR